MKIDFGKIKFTWKGPYSNNAVYEKDDIVYFAGSSFIHTGETPTTGIKPSARSHNATWDVMALSGQSNPNTAHKTVKDAILYHPSTERHIEPLDLMIKTQTDKARVLLQFFVFCELHQDNVFFIRRNGVEIGSSQPVDVKRIHGIATMPYDNDHNSTAAVVPVVLMDEAVPADTHRYSLYKRSTNAHAFALNRTLRDLNHIGYERGISTVIAQEIRV